MTNGSGVTDEELDKPNKRHLIPSANDPIQTTKDIMISMDKHFDMHNEINRAAIQDFITHNADVRPGNIEDGSKINMYGNEDVCKRTMEVTDGKQDARLAAKEVADVEDVSDQRASEVSYDDAYEEFTDCIDNYPCDGFDYWITLERSSHRDGSIYCTRGSFGYAWKNDYRIADRNEIKLAKTPVANCSVELYGYIAARDRLDPLLNYIVNIDRDEPIIIEAGSLIEMTGPKRGIEFSCNVLIEYDMRIKTGEWETNDLQLIDGVSILDELMTLSKPYTDRIHGDCGAIDITQMSVENAFEATVEVLISEVRSTFDLCLSCFTSGLHEEIRLFSGVIGESCGLRRHVVAVRKGKCLDLKFMVGLGPDSFAEHCRSFKATNHGCSNEQIKIESALVSLTVTWSSLQYIF
ncbi:hypothetical protein HU200_011901 [Digitaria exilis]|uniref:DUF6598 domain-containing protein n=1 Tax=Digitaria exilis TaxID=1010633 RepID=A0A835A9M9_9POAL|nr:hypothetical protein HU200_060776 [Digitaria exilis]KAF8752704.1 hypothetical protein HU200_011901 [Digitaria exilis]